MGSLIKEDGGDRESKGVNFQKASCTLDASVKIYSHRVDDTWSSSFRILDNLSRGSSGGDGTGEEGPDGKPIARIGTKAMSNRLNLASTIEKNISNINSDMTDCDHTADPMFHKMSQAFDEGGAKGMLMANLVRGFLLKFVTVFLIRFCLSVCLDPICLSLTEGVSFFLFPLFLLRRESATTRDPKRRQ